MTTAILVAFEAEHKRGANDRMTSNYHVYSRLVFDKTKTTTEDLRSRRTADTEKESRDVPEKTKHCIQSSILYAKTIVG